MTISEQTAQLILDALAWANEDWFDGLGWEMSENTKIALSRSDFIRFCEARGINEVERKVKL